MGGAGLTDTAGDLESAESWFQKAAVLGNQFAIELLAELDASWRVVRVAVCAVARSRVTLPVSTGGGRIVGGACALLPRLWMSAPDYGLRRGFASDRARAKTRSASRLIS